MSGSNDVEPVVDIVWPEMYEVEIHVVLDGVVHGVNALDRAKLAEWRQDDDPRRGARRRTSRRKRKIYRAVYVEKRRLENEAVIGQAPVRLACEAANLYQWGSGMPSCPLEEIAPWRDVPRTDAPMTCLACLALLEFTA